MKNYDRISSMQDFKALLSTALWIFSHKLL